MEVGEAMSLFSHLLPKGDVAMNIKRFLLQGATAAALLFSAVAAQAGSAGAAYTMTNDPDDNQVVVFTRDANGLLTKTDMLSTGGKGSGGGIDPLASQGALVLARDDDDHHRGGQWLLAVNAGSNDISVFQIRPDGVALRDRVGSGGTFPVSVTVSGDRVYVLNNGEPANITGFKLGHHGHLHPLAHSTRLLGAGSYGQVAFDPHGKSLTVVDKANDRILVYPIIHKQGLPAAAPVISPSSGNVPFGIAFDKRGHLLVVEAGSNAVSSYRLLHDGSLQIISASVANGQIATCWIAVNRRGDIVTTNPGTHSLSAFHVNTSGQVSLLNGTAGAGDAPLDIAITRDGRFAYAVDPVNGGVDMFKIEHDGSLTGLGNAAAGLAIFAQGMAVR